MTDMARLRALAMSATAGPWRVDRPEFPNPRIVAIAADGRFVYIDDPKNRAFIAEANPSTVLALLEWNAALEAGLSELVAEIERLHEPGWGQGYRADITYGEIDPACSTCGQQDEYAVPWPCATVLAARALLSGIADRANGAPIPSAGSSTPHLEDSKS